MLVLNGPPRSGTTWLAKAIDSHPDVYYLHEPDSEKKIKAPIWLNDEHEYEENLRKYSNEILNTNSLKVVGRLPFYKKSYQNTLVTSYNSGLVYSTKIINKLLSRNAITKLPLVKPKQNSAYKLFFKTIESTGRARAFSKCFPEIRQVLLARHPCGVINSEIKGESKKEFSSSTPIYENWGVFQEVLKSKTARNANLTLEKIKSMSISQRLAWRWLAYFKEQCEVSTNENTLLVKYENLFDENMITLTRVFDHLGLSITDSVKQYFSETTTSHNAAYYSLKKDPKISMNSWKQDMNEQQIQEIREIVGDEIVDNFATN